MPASMPQAQWCQAGMSAWYQKKQRRSGTARRRARAVAAYEKSMSPAHGLIVWLGRPLQRQRR